MEEQVIISVDLDDGKLAERLEKVTDRLVGLKQTQADLNKEFKAGNVSAEEYSLRSKSLSQEISTLSRQQGNLTQAVKLTTTATKDYGDSLDGERARLNDMQKAFAALSKEQRDSAAGQEFLRAIAEQDKAVKGLEQSIGDARRNVGDYEGAIKRAFPAIGNLSEGIDKATETFSALGKGSANAMKSLVVGLGNATKAALKFIATPIGAVLAAVVAAVALMTAGFRKLQEAFAKNDTAGTQWAKLMASFEPIIDGISRAFDKLAIGIGKVAEKIADWIGKNNEAAKAAQDLVTAQDNLEEAERQYVVGRAEREKTIAELRTKAKDREQYNAEQRKQFILEAIDLEEQQAQETKKQAAEKLRILEETAKKESDTSDATKNAIAAARAEMIRAETNYYNRSRELLEQRTTAENQYQQEMKQRTQERIDEYWREYEEQKAAMELQAQGLEALANVERIREEQKIAEEEELARLKTEAEAYVEEEEIEDVPSVEDVVRDKFGIDEEAIAYYNELLESGMDANERFAAMSEFTAKRGAKAFADAAGSMAGAFNNMAGFLNEYGESNKKAQKAARAFTLAGIFAAQAQSIAEGALAISAGIAQSQSVPFPANLVAIASTVATIMGLITSTASSFIQAKQLLSQSDTDAGAFATGGVVGGTSYTGDKLTARVNSREMILTQSQQARLFEIANAPAAVGGIDYEALAAAMSALPAPVMDYTEFKQFGQKVSTYNEITRV